MSLFPTDAEGLLVGERYRLVRVIGRGGMGVVYEALDETLDRKVALKFLDTNSSDAQFRERFGHEASVLARLASRHIVAIYDYEAQAERPYLVTQLVPDGDLHSKLTLQGAMAPAEALEMALQICEALADAHAEGILHRDIKPANVLLHRQRSGDDRAFLCDFGIAVSEDNEFTQTGAIVGTTSYLAPERLNGAPASIATDIYSLGCLIWAMLTGRAPYSGTDFQVMEAHVKAPPPQLVEDAELAEGINAFLARCMAKDPDRRLSSVNEVVGLLTTLLSTASGAEAGDLTPQSPPTAGADAELATRYVGPGAGPAGAVPEAATALRSPSTPRPSTPPRTPPPSSLPPRTPPPTVPPGVVTPAAAAGAADDGSTQPRKWWAGTPALLAAAVVVVAGIAVAGVAAGGGDGEPPTATDRSGASPSGTSSTPAPTTEPSEVGSSPSTEAASLTEVPELTARSAYRSVIFTADIPDGLVLQRLDDQDEWQPVEERSRKYTPMGGDRTCVEFRLASAADPAESGEPVTECARSQPPRIELVRTTQACTSANQQPGCRYYNIRAEGFTPGSAPLVYLYTSGTTLFCPACVPREMEMDDQGRGLHDGARPSSLGEVQITPSATYRAVTVEIDGVRRRFPLL